MKRRLTTIVFLLARPFAVERMMTASPSQTPSQIARPADTPKWEVISIRPCPPNVRSGAPVLSPGRMTDCETVFGFIGFAYIFFANGGSTPSPAQGVSIEGGPSWIRSERFSITAKAEGVPGDAMMRGPMLQAILEDRFKLKIRRETREIPVYVLTVAAGGPKLQPFREGTCTSTLDHPAPPTSAESKQPCQRFGMARDGRYKMDAQGISVEEFSRRFLSASLGRPVIDKTGITGYFDFHLEWAAPSLTAAADAVPDAALPSVVTVMGQLGLKLESAKGPGDFLVIDRVERPTEN